MVLWRISRHRELSGAGGMRAAGRWHFAGHPVVYLAETPAGAMLEACVHTSANDVPPGFILLRIEGPDIEVEEIARGRLPERWWTQSEVTRNLGSGWLDGGSGVLLRVPSELVPETQNVLFNPAHPDAARFRIAAQFPCPFDPRLKR